MKGKPMRAWLKGIKAWRLRTKESPCMYETEYLNTTDMWAGDVDITMYKDFRTPGGLSESLSNCIRT
jgi:hypothetical protein